jgi:hypothetical protein
MVRESQWCRVINDLTQIVAFAKYAVSPGRYTMLLSAESEPQEKLTWYQLHLRGVIIVSPNVEAIGGQKCNG